MFVNCSSDPAMVKRIKIGAYSYQLVGPSKPEPTTTDLQTFCQVGNEYAAIVQNGNAKFVGLWTRGGGGTGNFRYFRHDGSEHSSTSGLVLCARMEMRPIDPTGTPCPPAGENANYTPLNFGNNESGDVAYFLGKLRGSPTFGIVRQNDQRRFACFAENADGVIEPYSEFDALCEPLPQP